MLQMLRLPLVVRGCNSLVMFMYPGINLGVVDQLAHSCCEMEDLRALPSKVFATWVLWDEIR